MASYRAGRREKRQQKTMLSPVSHSSASNRKGGALKDDHPELITRSKGPGRSLLASTILEEENSSDAGF